MSLYTTQSREDGHERYAEERTFPIIPCNLCGSQENLERKKIKAMLREDIIRPEA